MTLAELRRHFARHRVPMPMLRRFLRKWRGHAFAWVLEDPQALSEPIAYKPKSGCQTWVNPIPQKIAQALHELDERKLRPAA